MRSSHAERLRELIAEEILTFKLRPGEKLDETRLADKYGTSRTPVREALRQLSSDGLIQIRHNRGAIVAKVGIRELVELLEVMAELEGACGRLAAKSSSVQSLGEIRAAQEACRKYAELRNAPGYQDADDAFHEAIYAASRNHCLIKLTLGIRNRVAAYRPKFEHSSQIGFSVSEHDQIVHAIQENLPEEADRLLQLHTINLGGDLRRIFSLMSDGETPLHSPKDAGGATPVSDLASMR
jgi:DNA-binding GntR family transcriptional regulator